MFLGRSPFSRPTSGRSRFSLAVALGCTLAVASALPAAAAPGIATFRCDMTPPLGQPLFRGDPLERVAEPLLAKGVVIESEGRRIVICGLDWCLVGNDSHLSMRRRLAEAVGTEPDFVAVQTIHQHNAPSADAGAQRLLAQYGDARAHLDPDWLDEAERRMAEAARAAVGRLAPFDRVGTGKGRVERVASNRRIRDAQGGLAGRGSLADPWLRELPEGEIDPFVRTVTFASGDQPLVRLHYYATHPQVKYGDGVATSDFVGLAREAVERDEGVFQIYFTGCGGDIAVGKYNDGTDECRRALAARLRAGMEAAIEATVFEPVTAVGWRALPIVLPRRDEPDFTAAICVDRIRSPHASPVDKLYLSAMRISSLHRANEPIVLGCLEAGRARILHLPGEPLLEFQRYAQAIAPEVFVAVAGYGDNTTGYIPPASEFAVGGYEPSVALCKPEAEQILKRAIADLLEVPAAAGPEQSIPAPAAEAAEKLPRFPPREPAEALESFELTPGYRIESVAAEPLVHSPVALDFDERGRLFVVEMIDYSEQADEHLGTVRLLEDVDGDGRYDTSTVYADGLSWPTGVLCFDGGVFVTAAPDILYLRDTDGDGRADERRVVFTGFSRNNVQGLLNSLRWGLDCRVHGATSSSGAPAVTRPDEPSFGPVNLTGRDFSFDPRRLDIRPESGCLQHGMSFDDWGRKFVSGNSQPLEMVFFEDRYAARNPLYPMPPSRGSIAVDGGADEVFRISPVEPWRILRTKMRVANPALGAIEGGGRPAGYFTGATGVTAYRGDAFPAEMRECLVVGDVGGNLVHRERLTPAGAFLEARRIDAGDEFLRSDDTWFRPAQYANAPDGSLHVLDVYREVIEHPQALPPVIKEQVDLTSGRDRGRIYRIVPEGFVRRPPPRLDEASTAELVALLDNRNGWHRDTALRLLFERQDIAAVPGLERLAAEADLPEGRLHALYALAALDRLEPAVLLEARANPHPRVREHAVRLAERLSDDDRLLAAILPLVTDDDARVRYQLAFSLGEFPAGPDRNAALARLAVRDGSELYPRAAILSSLRHGAGDVLERVAAATDADGRFLEELATLVGRRLEPEDMPGLERAIAAAHDDEAGVRMVQGFLAGRARAPAAAREARPLPEAIAAARDRLLVAARALALDDAAPAAEQAMAARRLALGGFAESEQAFDTLLQSRQPQEVQLAALAALAEIGAAETGGWLLARWPQFSPRLRAAAAETLFSREPWVLAFLDAVDRGDVALADIDPAQLRLLAARKEPAIRDRLGTLAARLATSPREEVIAAYRPALALPGDASRGREHFTRICAQCHQAGDLGHALGPSLAAFKARGPEAILVNVFDPNREVNPLYVNYVAQLADGRVLTGMIADETATSITLRRGANASDTVARADLEVLTSTGQSIMPEGIEQQLDLQGFADLLAFLEGLP